MKTETFSKEVIYNSQKKIRTSFGQLTTTLYGKSIFFCNLKTGRRVLYHYLNKNRQKNHVCCMGAPLEYLFYSVFSICCYSGNRNT